MAKARTLGQISDEILIVQGKIKKLDDEIDGLKKQKEGLAEELMLVAETQKLEKGGGKKSSFTIKPQTVPHVENWDMFYEFIDEQKYFHLLQRRPGATACAELWDRGMDIPGVTKFTQMKVTVKEA